MGSSVNLLAISILLLVLVRSRSEGNRIPSLSTKKSLQSQHPALPVLRWVTRQRRRKRPKSRPKKRRRKRGRKAKGPKLTMKSTRGACDTHLPGVSARIVGGGPAPWAAQYSAALFSGRKRCSGALVAAEWVLSAAHCVLRTGDLIMVGGRADASGSRRQAREIVRHPYFWRGRHAVLYDVMLVRLDAPVSMKPLALNSNMKVPRKVLPVRVSGYGRDSVKGRRGPLRAVDVLTLPMSNCRKRFKQMRLRRLGRGLVEKHHICANHDTCDVGVCFGDSGGPLVARDRSGRLVQIGITSYGGPRCGSRFTPDVYARVAYYQEWITRVTGGKSKFVRLRPM